MADEEKSGRDRLSERTEAWADKRAGDLADRPVRTSLGLLVKALLALFAIGAVFGVFGLACGWFNAGKDIVSPSNVREQYRAVIGDYKAMEQAACNAQEAANAKPEEGDPQLIETPGFAYRAKYREIAVDYDRRQANLFEAEKVGPKGYPRESPTIAQMQRLVC